MLEPQGNETTPLRPPAGPAGIVSQGHDAATAPRAGRLSQAAWPAAEDRPAALTGRWWGTRPGRLGVFTVVAAAFLGGVVTVLSGSEPGQALAIFILAGTVVAETVVRLRSAYLLLPVPALAYLAAAVSSGLIHDRAADTSRTALTLNGVQWAATGFPAMVAATALAIVIIAARWLWSARGRVRAPQPGRRAGH